MGKDKFENEDLIKYGLNEDIWWVKFNIFPICLLELNLLNITAIISH